MDYGKIVNRSVNIVWQNKFLILLGFLASLGSGSFGSAGGGENGGGGSTVTSGFEEEFAALAVGFIVVLVCGILFVGIVLWAISTIARGGLVAGVDTIESGEKSSFSQAWRAGWQKGWTLIGIGFLPAMPGFVLFVTGLLALGAYGGIFAFLGEELDAVVGAAGIGITLALVVCIVVPIVLALTILRTFAERACMLEDLGVFDAYRRGWSVLTANIGEAIILFVLQIAIFVVLGIFLFLPGLILVLCCFLWPLLLALQGAISAFVSAMWTLAWRTWTGGTTMVEKEPDFA